jgi:hypothetical protein
MIGVRAETMYCLFEWASSEGQRACVRAVAAPPDKTHVCVVVDRKTVIVVVKEVHHRYDHRYQMRMAVHVTHPL